MIPRLRSKTLAGRSAGRDQATCKMGDTLKDWLRRRAKSETAQLVGGRILAHPEQIQTTYSF
jgi:hypothetical protein